MKNFIFTILVAICTVFGISAQEIQNNYAGSSKWNDNWGVSARIGIVTPTTGFLKPSVTNPMAGIGVEKFVNPWLGFGVDFNTTVGHGAVCNTHTAFDWLDLNANVKVNVRNAVGFTGETHVFEPVVYTGLGWGHVTSSELKPRNSMSYRAGVEFNFNIGKSRAWCINLNTAAAWKNVKNMELNNNNLMYEIAVGTIYRFKNSNGKHMFSRARLYNEAEVSALKSRIAELEARGPVVVEKVVVEKDVVTVDPNVFSVSFTYDGSELNDDAKAVLNTIPTNASVTVDAYASKEPVSDATYNQKLAQKRCDAVKTYLESRGVTVADSAAHGVSDKFGRVAVVTVK